MFEKEIDEIYELCKRVVNEVPAAGITFEYSNYGYCNWKSKIFLGGLTTNLTESINIHPVKI